MLKFNTESFIKLFIVNCTYYISNLSWNLLHHISINPIIIWIKNYFKNLSNTQVNKKVSWFFKSPRIYRKQERQISIKSSRPKTLLPLLIKIKFRYFMFNKCWTNDKNILILFYSELKLSVLETAFVWKILIHSHWSLSVLDWITWK